MGFDLPAFSASNQSKQEELEVLARLRRNYYPHVSGSVDEGSASSRGSSFSSYSYSNGSIISSTRSSVSSAPSTRHSAIHRSTASYTSSIPSICERPESPELLRANVTPALPHPLSRSVSEYSLRDRTATFRSFPSHEGFVSKPIFVCTFCSNGFESRSDWETHEWLYHERQSYWPCPHPGCEVVFDSGSGFESHHEDQHHCPSCKHAAEVVRLLPRRKVWACGFDMCKGVFTDWNKRCKHVASHFEGFARRLGVNRESPRWTYSNTIRNLLRQPEIKESFKKFMLKYHGSSRSNWPKLEWQRNDTAELRQYLEYRDFRRGTSEIVQMAYRLGHPAYNAAVQVMSRPLTPPSEEASHALSRVQPDTSLHSPGSPPLRSPRSYMYERKISQTSSLTTLPEWAPLLLRPTKDYSLPRSLPNSPPAASPPQTRSTSPSRSSNFSLESRRIPTKRMVARDADVKGTGCAALIQFLRQGPPDELSNAASPTVSDHTASDYSEHCALRVPSPRPGNNSESQVDQKESMIEPQTPVTAAFKPLPPPSASPVVLSARTSLAVPDTPSTLDIPDTPSTLMVPETPTTLPPSPQPSLTSLSLFPSSHVRPPSGIVRTHMSLPSDIICQTANPMPPSSIPHPSFSPLPDLTDMNWPLPPPALHPPPRSTSLVARPATAGGDLRKRKKPRSLRWVSISHLTEPPIPSPGDVDFRFCLTQPLDLAQNTV
ncbi:hypothetical protein EJ08DRAFT_5601 [Tothia fuscella]|uniref:C2H2-type domain-containing protein n=1 Tax=Tothia fuscella TaxID=1048955 RepID=A0A9P4U597_9PEZI|nr:hypothetical protein EJ08DRAFT_5601 [Tothia fuscella]